MEIRIGRRDLITLLGGMTVWPLGAKAQNPRTVPRIGVLWHAGSAEEEAPYLTGAQARFQ